MYGYLILIFTDFDVEFVNETSANQNILRFQLNSKFNLTRSSMFHKFG